MRATRASLIFPSYDKAFLHVNTFTISPENCVSSLEASCSNKALFEQGVALSIDIFEYAFGFQRMPALYPT